MVFAPNTQNLFCENCHCYKNINHKNNIALHSLSAAIENIKNTKTIKKQSRFVNCPNCGSKIKLNSFEVSKECEYCGSNIVAQDLNLIVKKPDGIIPFMFDKKGVGERFILGVKKQFFVPNKFKKQLPESNIEGDYIPSFSFNVDVVYTYKGCLYKNETRTDSDGNRETVKKYFNISGADNKSYKNLLVESSSKIAQTEINGVVPFNYNQSKTYNDAYISGYVVEKYDNEVYNCLEKYNTLLNQYIRQDILSGYSYDGVSSLNITKQTSNETYSYYLVPVYKITYSYKNKNYITYMNGQTGRIDANIPKSGFKMFMVTGFPFLLVAIFIIIGIIFGH